LHIRLEVATVVNRLNRGFESDACLSVSAQNRDKKLLQLTLAIFIQRYKRRSIAQNDTFKQKGISCQMILRAKVNLVSTFFQRLNGN